MEYLEFVILALFISTAVSQRKIFGGEKGDSPTFNYVVYLRMIDSACTGCIIHEEWVLSAAHCVSENAETIMLPTQLTITAGTTDITAKSENVQVRNGREIYVHEDYYSKIGKPDLAVIRVDQPYKFNDHINKASFSVSPWPQNKDNIWDDCVAAGWGVTEFGISKDLKYLKTSARHGKGACPCIEKYYVLKRYVCLPNKAATGICFGDSGGALVCDGKIVGVAHIVIDKRSCSYTAKRDKKLQCGSPYVYGIYIYTCPYLNWIAEYVPGVPGTPESCKGTISSFPIASKMLHLVISLLFHFIYF